MATRNGYSQWLLHDPSKLFSLHVETLITTSGRSGPVRSGFSPRPPGYDRLALIFRQADECDIVAGYMWLVPNTTVILTESVISPGTLRSDLVDFVAHGNQTQVASKRGNYMSRNLMSN